MFCYLQRKAICCKFVQGFFSQKIRKYSQQILQFSQLSKYRLPLFYLKKHNFFVKFSTFKQFFLELGPNSYSANFYEEDDSAIFEAIDE